MNTRKDVFRRRHRTQRGKGRWKSGADTCVMKPVVACLEGLPPEVAANQDGYVSRIVAGTHQTSADAVTEAFLRTNFQPLIDAKVIVVSLRACEPAFVAPQDTTQAQGYREKPLDQFGRITDGCVKVGIRQNDITSGVARTNLITPKFGDNLNGRPDFATATQQDMFRYLKTAIIASVFLVPDNGPWLIHEDLHMGNVLQIIRPPADVTKTLGNVTFTLNGIGQRNDQYAIADWGRVLRIENVNSGQAFYNALTTRFPRGVGFDMLDGNTWDGGKYPQHPARLGALLRAYRDAHGQTQGTITPAEKAIFRGWMTYVLLYQCFMYYGADIGGGRRQFHFRNPGQPSQQISTLIDGILESTSQADLIARINALASAVGVEPGRDFIRRVAPVPAAVPCTDNVNATTSATAASVIAGPGRGTQVFAKEQASCSVRINNGKFVKLWLPDDQAARTRIGNLTSVLTTTQMRQRGSGVYTWLIGSIPGSNVRVLRFAHVKSALEVATAHLTLAAKSGFDRIYGAGEAKYNSEANSIDFNFTSGTYMAPILRENSANPQCQTTIREAIKTMLRDKFNGVTVTFGGGGTPLPDGTVTYITYDDLRLETKTLAEYIAAGVHVETFDSEAACRAALSPDYSRRVGHPTVNNAEASFQTRRGARLPSILYVKDNDGRWARLVGNARNVAYDIYEFESTRQPSVTFILYNSPADDTGRVLLETGDLHKFAMFVKSGNPTEAAWTVPRPEQIPQLDAAAAPFAPAAAAGGPGGYGGYPGYNPAAAAPQVIAQEIQPNKQFFLETINGGQFYVNIDSRAGNRITATQTAYPFYQYTFDILNEFGNPNAEYLLNLALNTVSLRRVA